VLNRRGPTRREVIKFGGAYLGTAVLASGKAPIPGRPQPPNILFITVDQLCSLADIPVMLPLPNIRRLVLEGRSFTNYHVNMAPCGPSRAVIYTGQFAQKTGMYSNPPGEYASIDAAGPPPLELPPSIPTIGTMLREQGFYTAYKGKWHLSLIGQRIKPARPAGYPDSVHALEPYGFSDYGHDGEHSGMEWAGFSHDGFIAADAINLMRRFSEGSTGGKPWFLAVNLVNPHDIMFYEGDDEVGPKGASFVGPVMKPPSYPPYDANWDPPLPVSFYKDDLSTKPSAQRGFRGDFSASAREIDAWKAYLNYYYNCIRDVDAHIGRLLTAVDRLGFAQNTIVVFTSDHGERGGAHGMSGKGGDMYKETVRVPLIVRGPGVAARGDATPALGSAVDLAPTLLALAGLSDSARAKRYPALHGVDLTPAMFDATARTDRDHRGILFDYVTANGPGTPSAHAGREPRGLFRGTFDGRHKFARYFALHEHHIPTDWATLLAHNDLELYDTGADPDELVNLAARPETQKDLILALNAKVNSLIANEIGVDSGAIYSKGEDGRYELKV
jgi:arylsulfatase A-like enzyme